MMKRLTLVLALFVVAGGCSDDDDNPTDPGGPGENTATTVWDEAGGYWRSSIDASDYEEFKGFSFVERDTADVHAKHGEWDIAFRREVVKLNGGASGEGTFEGADLGVVAYASVDRADSAGADWTADAIAYHIDAWYSYDPIQHSITMTRNVYSMLDASGDHYVKFRVDSLSGDFSMVSMGTVHLSYFYQPNAGDRDLSGAIETGEVVVGSGMGYFDFSTGGQVTPSNPSASLDWDISFHNYELAQNSGPSGTGEAAAFYAYGELDDPTDIAAFTEQPAGAPLFPDVPGSALKDWYDYNPATHQLSSKNNVYLLRSGTRLYKMKIEGYYADQGGVPVSGVYRFIWNEL